MRIPAVLLFFPALLPAQERTLTLSQAVDLALRQNPDLVLARLEERKAEENVRLNRDPFIPKVVVGSGLAYSNGFPMSIEGATPSIFQARALADVFNRPQSIRLAASKELRRGTAFDTSAKREDVALRTAEVFLDAERVVKSEDAARKQIDVLDRIAATVAARVEEGRELPIETKRAALNLAKARYQVQSLETTRAVAESTLAAVLGLEPEVRVRLANEERPVPVMPENEETAIKLAIANSKELRALESRLLAKNLEVRANRANRLPRLDLVAQYGLLAKFNNYDEFFRRFQRHNGQIGVSFQVPLWNGPGVDAGTAQAQAEVDQVRTEIQTTRGRLSSETRRRFLELQQAQTGQEVARLDLELAREQVSVLLAQNQEGRTPLRQVEEARFAETERWVALYDSLAVLEKARYGLLRQVGTLLSALQ